MSWIKTAVNKAVEAGGNNNLTRTVRCYADSVVVHAGNAVSGGARIIQDRIGYRNMQNFKHTVKMLEEVSVSTRGVERVQLLRRWLVALKEIERLFENSARVEEPIPESNLAFVESKESPKIPTLVLYVDPEKGGEPKNFRDVFLYSQALEGITLSMILDEPTEEEAFLLSELYRLCLTGGKEVQESVLTSIQSLAKAFSNYQDEVLAKREELLQYVHASLSGLKYNADLMRIDAEAWSLKAKIDSMKAPPSVESSEISSETTFAIEALKEALAQVQLCSKLEAVLLHKKRFSYGDSPQLHVEKLNKLKVLAESLANSCSKAEKRILDQRSQKEEALSFRVAKSIEVSQVEKDLVAEIENLDKRKDELEDELKQVCKSLASARARLHNAREERDQFDEANNEILAHFASKDEELVRSVKLYRTEAKVVDISVNFLESTWAMQISRKEKKDKHVSEELEKYGAHFVHLVMHLLSSYKENLRTSVTHVRKLVEDLSSSQSSETSSGANDGSKAAKTREELEEEYLELEAKFVTILSIVDTMKKQFFIRNEGIFRKDEEKVKELFNSIDKIKEEFGSTERPLLDVEDPQRSKAVASEGAPTATSTIKHRKQHESADSIYMNELTPLMTTLRSESETERGDDLLEDIGEWEFDARGT